MEDCLKVNLVTIKDMGKALKDIKTETHTLENFDLEKLKEKGFTDGSTMRNMTENGKKA